jgi:F-type H+-transporting ATPase subunit epsilon
MTIQCNIISQDRIVYQGAADIVEIPGSDGEMGILPEHSPLITTMQYGVIEVKKGNEVLHFTVAGGVVEVLPDQITILADAAENVEEIDLARAEAAMQRAETLMKSTPHIEPARYESLIASLKKSHLRINAARKYRKNLPLQK